MKKIPTLFVRDMTTKLVTPDVTPGCEWVIAGDGVATEKADGTCCLARDGKLYKRYDAKQGRTPPTDFEPAQPEPDPNTGHWPGWVPVGDGAEDKWHREAWTETWNRDDNGNLLDGTYELVGPKVQGNPYDLDEHQLWRHGDTLLLDAPNTYAELEIYLRDSHIEGIVWHHLDGRMAKLKRKDFGLQWPVREVSP